jgi:hypothetical protein
MIATTHIAAPPGDSESDKARVCTAGRVGEQIKADTLDCTEAGDDCKSLATTRAVAAMAGCQLHELASGGFLVARWNLSREFGDLQQVRRFLKSMGVQA